MPSYKLTIRSNLCIGGDSVRQQSYGRYHCSKREVVNCYECGHNAQAIVWIVGSFLAHNNTSSLTLEWRNCTWYSVRELWLTYIYKYEEAVLIDHQVIPQFMFLFSENPVWSSDLNWGCRFSCCTQCHD